MTLAYGETDFRKFTNSQRPIQTRADMEGLKFRVQPVPLYLELVKGLGGEPAPIAWTELPNALATGVVDGQENPDDVIYSNGLHKLQKYMTLDGHVYAADFLITGRDTFDMLTPEQQSVVRRAAKVTANFGRFVQQWNTANGVTAVQEEGMEVHVPTEDDLALFCDAAQPAVKEWLAGDLGPEAVWIEKLDAAVQQSMN